MKDLVFLKDGISMNHNVMKHGLADKESFTNTTSRMMIKNNWRDDILLSVTAAIGTRMLGCPLPVMASNDSGDHGLTVNLPQYIYHLNEHTTELMMLQAIAFTNLITWKIKKNIGSLSAYCGSVVAATTATMCGLAYQRNHNTKQINDLINFCLCSYAGALCDGAKLSCSWKVQSAMLAGFQALGLVEHGSCLPKNEGLINDDSFKTIKELGNLSRAIMNSTNNELIAIIEKNLKND